MGDKEPRRRKKRKDSQRKDELRTEDTFIPTKSEARDSDQETEEEIPPPVHHQPSSFAKIVFVLLFSGLVISMSFIFISLQGTERGPVDIFDDGHAEEHEEILHETHDEESSPEPIQDEIDLFPDISNILSFNEQVNENQDETVEFHKEPEVSDFSESFTEVSKDNLDSEEEYTERSEPLAPDVAQYEEIPYEDNSKSFSDNQVPNAQELYQSAVDLTPSTIPSEQEDSLATNSAYEEIIDSTKSPFTDSSETSESASQNNFEPMIDENQDQSEYPYEKSDITNEDDYSIRNELDDIEKYVEKDVYDDDNYDTEEDIDVDDVDEEFVFWNF